MFSQDPLWYVRVVQVATMAIAVLFLIFYLCACSGIKKCALIFQALLVVLVAIGQCASVALFVLKDKLEERSFIKNHENDLTHGAFDQKMDNNLIHGVFDQNIENDLIRDE